jgi:hypothetical protein
MSRETFQMLPKIKLRCAPIGQFDQAKLRITTDFWCGIAGSGAAVAKVADTAAFCGFLRMNGFRLLLAAGAGVALLAAQPGLADVKAGAEAWARGDYAAAVAQWQGPADAGDTDAQFNLAQAYKLGRGVPRDLTKAELLFSKAAAAGHLAAADNYGLLLFDRGERGLAMPYVRAGAARGDPRAQYLLGIAHFNGDLAPKDWVRAYALMTLAQSAGLPQAAPALAQMDQYIPMEQRQAAASLAPQLGQKADAARLSQGKAADLAAPAGTGAAVAVAAGPKPALPSVTPPMVRPAAAVASAVRTAGAATAATAGADYARPAVSEKPAPAPASKPPAPKPAPAMADAVPAKPKPKPAPAPAPAAASGGRWRVQFGAFGVAANADALWAKVRSRPEVTGHPRVNVPSGKVSKLQATGYVSREAAAAACSSLSKAGLTCIAVQD